MTKILIVDTSIMCVWLKVPGKEVAGKSNEYTYDIVARHIEEERQKGTKLVLPIATIIETGNHIAHSNGNREYSIDTFSSMIVSAAIVQIAQQFAPTCEVEIFTGDGGLKNYEYKIQGQAKKELRRNRNKGK